MCGKRTTPPASIAPFLLHEREVSYNEAVKALTDAGYAVWDTLAGSERKGSIIDCNIRRGTEVFADIPGFVSKHPSVTRIAFVTGQGSAKIFLSGFQTWLKQNPSLFCVGADACRQRVFGGIVGLGDGKIELVVLESVSPAYVPRPAWDSKAQASRGFDDEYVDNPVHAYCWKRNQWFEQCFSGEEAVKSFQAKRPFPGEADHKCRQGPRDHNPDCMPAVHYGRTPGAFGTQPRAIKAGPMRATCAANRNWAQQMHMPILGVDVMGTM